MLSANDPRGFDVTQNDRSYVILNSEVLVSQDMAQCIVEMFPAAKVLQFQTAQALSEALTGLGPVDTAFLELRSIAQGGDKIIAKLESLGGKIVLLGAEDNHTNSGQTNTGAGRSDQHWRDLPLPFDSAMLRQRLV